MGYISSVEDARKKLEDIYKLEVEDSKESSKLIFKPNKGILPIIHHVVKP